MKTSIIKKTGFQIFALFAALTLTMPTASADIESLEQFKNDVLDGIEESVINSGLPALKTKLWEDHGLLIKPFMKFRYDLTSNVFKAPDTDSDHTDNLWTFTPGVQWMYKMDRGVIGGAYEASFRYFTQFSEQNEQDQKLLVYANLFPTDNLYIRASEKLSQQGATAGSSAFKPVDFLDNTVTAVVGYKMGKWTAEFGYENFDRDFSTTIANRYSYNEDKFDYRIYRQVDENVRVYTGVRLGQVDFWKDPTRDTFYHEIPIGVEATLPHGFKALASIGYHHRNLEEASRNDLTHVVTNVSLQRLFNDERTSAQLGFLRRPVESSFSTATTYDEKLWYGNMKHLVTPQLRARWNIYYGNRDFEERVFTGTRIVVGGAVFVASPSVVKRSDHVFGTGIGFDYNVRKWLILHMDYQYSRRNSNISALDYTENVFSLGSTIPL